MSRPGRIDLRAVAERAGVSAMTVSRALRDHPEVSAATRQRIRQLAAEMGYRPDPALAALAAYRHSLRTVRGYGTIAFVTNFASAGEWREDRTFAEMYGAAEKRAAELGYRLEPFWLRASNMGPRRASEILFHRGIRGLLIAPLPQSVRHIRLNWEPFAAVALGRSLLVPALHTVSANQAHTVTLAWRELRHRGYRRIGLALTFDEDKRTDHLYVAVHLREQTQHGAHALPVHLVRQWDPDSFRRWLKRYRPDAIISPSLEPCRLLERVGIAVPDEIAFAGLNVPRDQPFSGVDQRLEVVGARAIDFLHLKLQSAEFGVPNGREAYFIDGIWHVGETVPKGHKARSAG